jgi:hypothetical protein
MRNYNGRRFIGTCLCCNSDPALLSSIDRRTVLSGAAAIGLAASASIITRAAPALAQAAQVSKPPLIDVHHHFVPPVYLAENRDRVSPAALQWEPQKAQPVILHAHPKLPWLHEGACPYTNAEASDENTQVRS